jgi:hypothetical protein
MIVGDIKEWIIAIGRIEEYLSSGIKEESYKGRLPSHYAGGGAGWR